MRIDYLFTPVSPYCHLAGDRLERIAAARGAEIVYRPADFGRVFAEIGTPPVAGRHPFRQAYRLQELTRWSKRLGIPLTLHPAHFPTDPGPATRALAAAAASGRGDVGAASRAMLRAVWVEEKNLAEPEVIAAALAEAGCDPDLAADPGAEAGALVDANTEFALENGCIGAPFYVVGEARFWGQDRLDLLDAHLAGELEPVPEMQVAGRRVTWREAGLDRPGTPLLLAHCSLAHSGLWKPIMARLAGARPVLAMDMPAHGGSEPPPEGASLQLHAVAAAEALLGRVGGRAHLAGLSLGGATLGRLALARPDLAVSLTLIEPVWFFLLRPAGRHAEADAGVAFDDELERRWQAGDRAGAARWFVEAWGAPGGWDALGPKGQAYAEACLGPLRDDFAMISQHPPGQITAADIAANATPLLLLQGAETHAPAKAALDVVAAARPDAERAEIPGAGHLSPVTHPDAVADRLEAFLSAVEARAA